MPLARALSTLSESKNLHNLQALLSFINFYFKTPLSKHKFYHEYLSKFISECRSDSGGDRLGLGANTGDVDEDDDEFDQYRKRMMLAYRFRPNPLVCKTNIL